MNIIQLVCIDLSTIVHTDRPTLTCNVPSSPFQKFWAAGRMSQLSHRLPVCPSLALIWRESVRDNFRPISPQFLTCLRLFLKGKVWSTLLTRVTSRRFKVDRLWGWDRHRDNVTGSFRNADFLPLLCEPPLNTSALTERRNLSQLLSWLRLY